MNLLGYSTKGYIASEHDHVLPDGRVVGPFESEHAKALFARWFDKAGSRIAQARDLFEGTITGDEYRVILTDEVSLEMHPFVEITDVWLRDDNGKVVFDTGSGFASVDPRRLVLVDCPEAQEKTKTLSEPLRSPVVFDLTENDRIEHVIAAKQDGQIVVIDTNQHTGADYLVAWRIDGRVRKELVGLSRHSHEQLALNEAKVFARDFMPPYKPNKNRPRDEQRERLYLWEHSFGSKFEEFEDLLQAQELADEICADLRIKAVPVKLGRKDLSASRYKGGEIILSHDMLDNHTVVHEVAHHAVAQMKGVKEPAHGPKFAGVFLALLVRYMGVNENEALQNAAERGIVVDRDALKLINARFEPVAGSVLKI